MHPFDYDYDYSGPRNRIGLNHRELKARGQSSDHYDFNKACEVSRLQGELDEMKGKKEALGKERETLLQRLRAADVQIWDLKDEISSKQEAIIKEQNKL